MAQGKHPKPMKREIDLSDAIRIANESSGKCMGCQEPIVLPSHEVSSLLTYLFNQAPKYSGWVTGKLEKRSEDSLNLDSPLPTGNLSGGFSQLGSGLDQVIGKWGDIEYRDFEFIDTSFSRARNTDDILFVCRDCTNSTRKEVRMPIWLLKQAGDYVKGLDEATNVSRIIIRALHNELSSNKSRKYSHLVIEIDDQITKEIEVHLSDASKDLEEARSIIKKYRNTVNEVAEKLVDSSDDA